MDKGRGGVFDRINRMDRIPDFPHPVYPVYPVKKIILFDHEQEYEHEHEVLPCSRAPTPHAPKADSFFGKTQGRVAKCARALYNA
jgi:hypothetical protein